MMKDDAHMEINIKDLSKRYKKTVALDGISMSIPAGIYGLLGPNGAGKTTLLKILATVLTPDSGSITWGNLDWKVSKVVKPRLGYLPQQFGMYSYLKAEETLRNVAVLKKIDRASEDHQINLAMERADLTRFKNKKVGQLSGGMLRRLGIAQALLGEPDLLLLDEPSVGLDPEERIRLMEIIRDYDNGNRVILISSHLVKDIENLCSNIAVMNEGKILYDGSIETILDETGTDTLEGSYICMMHRRER